MYMKKRETEVKKENKESTNEGREIKERIGGK
jgi:hypothetical protein